MATNYPGALDTDATVGGGSKPASSDALDYSTGQPTHAGLHQNVGDAIEQIQTKLGTGASSPVANKALVSNGTASEWGQITAAMIASGQSPSFTTVTATNVTATNLTGELQTAAQPHVTSVGTLTGLLTSGTVGTSVVSVDNGSVSAPSFTFTSDTGNGMYLSGTDEISFATGGTQRLKITSTGLVNFTGTSALSGTLSLTTSTTGFHYVMQNDLYGTFWKFASVRDTKEQITNVTAEDSGRWIDALKPVTYVSRWLGEGDEPADAREFRLADMQVGFIADDVLANSDTDHFAQVSDNGHGGLDPEGWKWECVIAAAVAEIKSLRARVTALEG